MSWYKGAKSGKAGTYVSISHSHTNLNHNLRTQVSVASLILETSPNRSSHSISWVTGTPTLKAAQAQDSWHIRYYFSLSHQPPSQLMYINDFLPVFALGVSQIGNLIL